MDANTTLCQAVTQSGRGIAGWLAPRFDLVTDGLTWIWHQLNTWQRVVALGVLALCVVPWVYLMMIDGLFVLLLFVIVPLVTMVLPASVGRWINLVWVSAWLLIGGGLGLFVRHRGRRDGHAVWHRVRGHHWVLPVDHFLCSSASEC